ncbi:hypothetical protein ACIBQ6_21340 [Nonomuraea sp. NPDC049655]|uniref:hypothetical protein n=1 Tax=Nonomuraea sp. NPDC049655 TaxID=3364355 RepID=UPI0037B8474A
MAEETEVPPSPEAHPPDAGKDAWLVSNFHWVLLMAFLLMLAFFIGRATADIDFGAEAIPTANPCDDVRKIADKLTAKTHPSDDVGMGVIFHLINDNPSCFTAELVAAAKTGLDQMNVQGR